MSSSSITASAPFPPDNDPIARARDWIANGRAGDAAVLLENILAHGRGGLLTRLTRVEALVAAGRPGEAVAAAREAAQLAPDAAPAAICLGEALLASENLPAAIAEFQRALRLEPESAQARYQLGCAWLAAGEAGKALESFDSISAAEKPSGFDARRDEARAAQRLPRADARYVRHLFDQFSADYDARMLGQLGYTAPPILRQLFELFGRPIERRYAILDLGCGTGLSGEAFKDLALQLEGVDLSPAMLAKAQARDIYDTLERADIESALHAGRSRYDLIIAADTLVYLGDLRIVFAGAAARLAAGGLLLFTVEQSKDADFELGPKRRWRHAERYLREETERVGLDVAGLIACNPRSEAGIPVEGLAVALEKA